MRGCPSTVAVHMNADATAANHTRSATLRVRALLHRSFLVIRLEAKSIGELICVVGLDLETVFSEKDAAL